MTAKEEMQRMKHADVFRRRHYKETKTQCEMVVEYIEKYGSITPLEALNGFGCFRLGARVSDLKKLGYNITTEINSGGGKGFGIYRIEG